MLEEFLDVNNVDAEIITFPRDTSVQSALFETRISPASAIVAEFFMDEKDNEFIFVHSIQTRLDLEKLKKITRAFELFLKNPDEIFEATGYKKEFLPPIGVYGVTAYLDRSLQGKENLLCKVGERAFLKISPQELIDVNEQAFVDAITKSK